MTSVNDKLINQTALRDKLIIGATCSDNTDCRIIEILERYDAKISQVKWQSKYNDYICYDFEPFCTDGFIKYFYISGNEAFLVFLKHRIDKFFENRVKLEKLYKE